MSLLDKILNGVGKEMSMVYFLICYYFVYDVELYEQLSNHVFESQSFAGMCSIRMFSPLDDSVK